MRTERTLPRGLRLLALASAAAFAGCIVVAPIEDLPDPVSGSGGAGASGTGGTEGSGATGNGGNGATGTGATGGTGEAGGAAGDAADAGGTNGGSAGRVQSAGHAGTPESGAGGEGGEGGERECTTNEECVELGGEEPYRCRQSDGRCIQLRSNECPLVYGDYEAANPHYFGSFATLSKTLPQVNSVVWAELLAVDEINAAGGIPSGPDDTRRPLVMVVCNNDDLLEVPVVDAAMRHLVENVGVDSLLATLKPADLQQSFESFEQKQPFYLSPVGVTSVLTAEEFEDDGLIWNLLGQPSDFADAYAKLLTHVEAHVRRERSLPDPQLDPLKVALVSSSDVFNDELAEYVFRRLHWNGSPAPLNAEAGNYLRVDVEPGDPNMAVIVQSILDFAPDILISTAAEAMTQDNGIVEGVETRWDGLGDRGARPYYILSPYNAGNPDIVLSWIHAATTEPNIVDAEADQRFLGISAASAEDETLQKEFETRLRGAHDNAISDTGNYYDAVYFLTYAIRAANQPEGPSGPATASAMRRLIEGERHDVGPDHIEEIFELLGEPGASISLYGTLGAPDFDPETGVRRATPSVFCFEALQEIVLTKNDVLRYEREAGVFTGDYPCIDGFLDP
jgi:hypothetical protein